HPALLSFPTRRSSDLGARAEVVRRRLAYDSDPPRFCAAWHAAERELADRIVAARTLLPGVALPDRALRQVASVCAAFGVDGLRRSEEHTSELQSLRHL